VWGTLRVAGCDSGENSQPSVEPCAKWGLKPPVSLAVRPAHAPGADLARHQMTSLKRASKPIAPAALGGGSGHRSRGVWALLLAGAGRCGECRAWQHRAPAGSCNGAGRRSGTSPPGAILGSIFRGPSAFGRIGILIHLKRECQRLVVLPDHGSPLPQFSIVPVEATPTRGRIGSALGKLILIGAKIVAEDGGQSSDDAP